MSSPTIFAHSSSIPSYSTAVAPLIPCVFDNMYSSSTLSQSSSKSIPSYLPFSASKRFCLTHGNILWVFLSAFLYNVSRLTLHLFTSLLLTIVVASPSLSRLSTLLKVIARSLNSINGALSSSRLFRSLLTSRNIMLSITFVSSTTSRISSFLHLQFASLSLHISSITTSKSIPCS